MNFLKFTGDGRGIIGFCLCHLIFLFDNAPIKVRFGLAARPVPNRFALRKPHYCLILPISQYPGQKICKNRRIKLRRMLAMI